MIGRQVNNFTIVRLLGEGGMGAVYEAEHPTLRRKVAVKVLKRDLALEKALVQRFINEARAANSIRHPNIIEIVDVGLLADGLPYLMMELLEGENLARRLNRLGTLTVPEAVDIVLQAASALGAAHVNGIVHRDLKPDNLFLIADQRFPGCELVKVLDFGIAKLRADHSATPLATLAGVVFGTPPYMSPEQCRGLEGEVDHRADVYALGIILYELLCGRAPFTAAAYGDVMMMQMSAAPVPPSRHRPDLPPALEAVILKALAKDQQQRFQSMAEMSAALVPFCELTIESDSLDDRRQRALLAAMQEQALPGPPGTTPSPGSGRRAGSSGPRPGSHRTPPPPPPGQIETWRPAQAGAGPWRARVGALLGVALGLLVVLGAAAVLRISSQRKLAATPPSWGQRAEPGERTRPVRASVTPLPTRAAPVPPEMIGDGPAHAGAEAGSPALAPGPARTGTRRARPFRRGRGLATPLASPSGLAEPAPDGRRAAPTPPGFLSLDSAPWANVSLGQQSLGSTPLFRVPLPPGRHVLTLSNPELQISTSYVVEIKSGAGLSRFVGWQKE